MVCKGICAKHKSKKPKFGTNERYRFGQKRCSTWEMFINWDGKHCPCCGFTLRTRPRNTQGRRNLQEKLLTERI